MNKSQLDSILRNANPLPNPAERDDDVVQTDALLLWIKQRSGIMYDADNRTEHAETTTPTFDLADTPAAPPLRGSRNRVGVLVAGVAFLVVLIAGAVVGSSMLDNEEPAAPSREGAQALIGTTGEIIGGGQALSLPDAIRFAENGTYQVIQDGDTIDNGVYQTEGDLISFESDATHPVWENTPCYYGCKGAGAMCDGYVGEYRVTAHEASMFTLDVVWDECNQRLVVANELLLEVSVDGTQASIQP